MSYRPSWVPKWPAKGLVNGSVDEVVALAAVYFADTGRPATFVDVLCPGEFTVDYLVGTEPAADTKYMIMHYVWQLATKDMFPDIADPQKEIRAHGSTLKRCRSNADRDSDRPYKVPKSHCGRTWAADSSNPNHWNGTMLANPHLDHVLGPFGTPTALETKLGAWVFTVRFGTATTIWNSGFERAIDRDTRHTADYEATDELISASWAVLVEGLRRCPHLLTHISAMLRDYKTSVDDEWARRRDELWEFVEKMPCFSGFFKEDPTLRPGRLLQQLAAL